MNLSEAIRLEMSDEGELTLRVDAIATTEAEAAALAKYIRQLGRALTADRRYGANHSRLRKERS